MQDGKRKNPSTRRQASNQPGRVIDMKQWKATKRRRIQGGGRGLLRGFLVPWNYFVSITTIILTLASCMPMKEQLGWVIWSWFSATVGLVTVLWMHVLRMRYTNRWFMIYVLCMLAAGTAAVVKLFA